MSENKIYDNAENGEKRKKSRLPQVLIAVIAVAVVVSAFVYAGSYMKKNKESGGGKGKGQQNSSTVYTVRTEEAAISTLEDYVNSNGNVESLSAVSVYPNMNGKVVSVSVNLGSRVSRGDIIARIDPSQPGVNYALSPVTAPISGTVISTPLDIGTTVSTGTAIATIGDISLLQVTTYIPEKYVGYMKVGLQADITLEAYPDAVFPATVTYVSPVLEAATRTKEIVLRFEKADYRINAGMFAKVKLYTVKHSGYVTVPSSAIITNAEKKYIYVVHEKTEAVKTEEGEEAAGRTETYMAAEQREITEGNSVDGFTQIIAGLSKGERIVIEGGRSLFDGARVNDIATKSE